MYKFERTFGLQWLTCFPDVRPIPDTEPFKTHPVKSPALQSNSNLPGSNDESAYCKLCSVSMPNDQAEKHIYWHIARMFSTCRYKCRICKMEDSDREQLAERCGNKHATSSTDEELIEDQSRMSGSQLPELFRACAEKCFNAPPASLSYHLTDRSTGQPRTMTVTVLRQQGQSSNESPNTTVASPPPKLDAMGSDESQPPSDVKCRLCDERVAVGEEGTHGEVHLMVSGIWKRFGCGRCDFGAETSDEVELHYGKDHGVDFTEFYERSRPSGDEVDSMRRRCFSADQSTSDGVIDLTCEPIEEVICPKGDVSKQKSSVEGSLTCAFCKTGLISDPYLHVHTIHMNKKRFDCIRCNKSYGTKEQLKAHITLVHTNIDIDAAVKQAFGRLQKRMSAFMQICFGIK
uniref:C2H2-type domain-containing protein n=1 Tax=Plectus sambesii TaxID=2011161 RepID=A0A914UG81_9BILA